MRARAAGSGDDSSLQAAFDHEAREMLRSNLRNPEVRNRWEVMKRRDPNAPMFAAGVSFSGNEANPLFHNTGSGFEEIGTTLGISRREDGRGFVLVDLDQDGALDVVLRNHYRNPVVAMLNRAAAGNNWVRVRLRGTKSNKFGIGARVSVTAGPDRQVQELACGSGYVSGNAPELHFGVGTAERISLSVRWPSGEAASHADLPVNHVFTMTEGSSAVPHLTRLRPVNVQVGDPPPPPSKTFDVRAAVSDLLEAGEEPVVTVFYTVNCHVCIGELDRAKELEERARQAGARLLWVNVDQDPERAKEGLKELGAEIPLLRLKRPIERIPVPTVYLLADDEETKFMGRHGVTAAIESAKELK